jgi:plastocyanin
MVGRSTSSTGRIPYPSKENSIMMRALYLGIMLTFLASCGSSRGGYAGQAGATKKPAASTLSRARMVAPGATYAFQPTEITVYSGTTVTWTNDSSADHTVTADSGAWSSSTISHGQSYSRTFIKPGRYAYVCGLHGYMTGVVVVK